MYKGNIDVQGDQKYGVISIRAVIAGRLRTEQKSAREWEGRERKKELRIVFEKIVSINTTFAIVVESSCCL